ncbi:MAG: hypothetical protein M3R09_07680 [Actinomycetota bacterium]|nr:hypothetical protein [Actinomycetota bacterium]
MTPTDLPTRPDDVANVALTELAAAYASHQGIPMDHRDPLAVLAYGTVLSARIDADRWPNVVAALTEGADLADVAEAMNEHPEGVRVGLALWAIDQHREGSVSDTRYKEIRSLVDVGCEAVNESGPR